MIPDLAKILEMFKAGECTMTQALGWIECHMENADLRDHFAGQVASGDHTGSPDMQAKWAYQVADAMLKARAL